MERFAKRAEGRFYVSGTVTAYGDLPQRFVCSLNSLCRGMKIGTKGLAEERWIRMDMAGPDQSKGCSSAGVRCLRSWRDPVWLSSLKQAAKQVCS